MFLPLLSESDPKQSQEGSIDPLGTYAIADALAVRLAPGIRERQARPRFLTAMAVSFDVCSGFDEETVAKDHVSEPWQVFEWYVVEALVRCPATSSRLNRVPGSEKVATAVRNGWPISASRYLKTPSVFGFHGVYRTLARELRIETLGVLGETGYEVLRTWVDEQGLPSSWNSRLVDAVEDGLAKGHTCRSGPWGGWNFLAQHLFPDDTGKNEAKVLVNALLREGDGFRRQVIDFLVTPDGQSSLSQRRTDGYLSEKTFHKGLRAVADGELKALLSTIKVYEEFSRYLQDAFDDALYEMSRNKQRLSPKELTGYRSVRAAAENLPDLYERLVEILESYDLAQRFRGPFEGVSQRLRVEDWAATLLEHHRCVQREKPPNGKAPWFERFDDGTFLIRPAYLRDKPALNQDEYAHYYRTGPLQQFSKDLGLVK